VADRFPKAYHRFGAIALAAVLFALLEMGEVGIRAGVFGGNAGHGISSSEFSQGRKYYDVTAIATRHKLRQIPTKSDIYGNFFGNACFPFRQAAK
jgi:hypothetical protein